MRGGKTCTTPRFLAFSLGQTKQGVQRRNDLSRLKFRQARVNRSGREEENGNWLAVKGETSIACILTLRSLLAASDKWLVMEMTCDSNIVKEEKSGPC